MRFIDGPLRWGIIGCGDVCEVKSGPAFSKVKDSSLVAVMRRDGDKAADFARRHHVDTWYSDASDLIHDARVNAVYIATPPSSHEAYAIEAMTAGKPVYIEKPVSLNSPSCRRMLASSRTLEIPAVVAHYRRALDLFIRVKELVNEGAIGKPSLIQLNLLHPAKPTNASENWRVDPSVSGGGLFFDLAPHQLDIIYWIFGKALSFKGTSVSQGTFYKAPDVTSLSMVLPGDVFFQGLWSFNVPQSERHDSCRIVGDKGSISFPFFASFASASIEINNVDQSATENFTFPVNIQQPMIQQVADYFTGKGENPCSLAEAVDTLEIMENC
jgi:1,5-anhydro-D-fructose reductase (1,5-anhydro-D-mannitol-forming)